jgi:transposase
MLTEKEIEKMSVEELRRLVAAQHLQIQSLMQKLFGHRSEKLSRIDEEQQLLFNEIEVHARSEEEEQADFEKQAPLFVQSHVRKKPGRRPLPASLPRRDIVHDLDEKVCSKGHALQHIGEDVSERLSIIPMQVEVERHIRHKYVCPVCSKQSKEAISPDAESEIITAPGAPTLIPGSIITSALLAHIITGKFCDALPFYRLEKIFSRSGIDLNRATMCFWSVRVAKTSIRLRKLLWDELRRADMMHVDETRIQVLKEPGRKATAQSFLWAYRATTDSGTITFFEYRMNRSGDFLPKRLRGFRGTLLSDAYSGYNSVDAIDGIKRAGCWAHVRRKFFEAKKLGSADADWFLDKIAHLYRIEEEARNGDAKKRLKARQRYSIDIVDEIKAYADAIRPGTLPGSPLAMSMTYMVNEWKRLTVFLEDGRIPIDNNPIENDIRPFVIGRKNWLFNDSQKGASASAFFYSLIQTAKANGHEPYWYLRYLFDRLPDAGRDLEKLRALLPVHVTAGQVAKALERKK